MDMMVGPSSSGSGSREDKKRMDDGDAASQQVGDIPNGDGHHAGVTYRTYRRRWFGLVQLTLLNIMVSWDWLTFAPVSQFAAEYYKTSEASINWLSTAFLFAFVFIFPVTIYILHRGPKPSIIISAVLVLLGNWVRYAGSYSGDGGMFGVVMLGQLLTGLAQPFVLSAPTRYSDLWFTNRGRVAATALMSLANPLGGALGQLVVPFLVSKASDISSMVLYVSIISSVCAIPSFFVPAEPPTPANASSETAKEPLVVSARKLAGSLEFWLLLIPYGIFVGAFNSVSSLLNQIMTPYGFSSDDAGIAGALLIVVGLVASAIASPILDRTKAFMLAIRICVPVIAVMYLIFIWMPGTRHLAGPYVALSILGASSFSLVPVALEYLVDLAHPCSPEVTSTVAWALGQLLGGLFILIMSELKAGADANPPGNMENALIFQAVLALAVVPLPMSLGLFGRKDKIILRRVASDNNMVHHVESIA